MKKEVKRKNGWLLLMLLTLGAGLQLNAQNVKVVSRENFIAKCLYNFAWYINWPEQYRKGDFVVGVIGDKDLYNELSSFTQSKKVAMQLVRVKYFNSIDEASDHCHIVFIPSYHSKKLKDFFESSKSEGTLYVTEREGMLDVGSVINFIPKDGILKFEISKHNAQVYGLQVSSRLEDMSVAAN